MIFWYCKVLPSFDYMDIFFRLQMIFLDTKNTICSMLSAPEVFPISICTVWYDKRLHLSCISTSAKCQNWIDDEFQRTICKFRIRAHDCHVVLNWNSRKIDLFTMQKMERLVMELIQRKTNMIELHLIQCTQTGLEPSHSLRRACVKLNRNRYTY